MWFRMNFTSSVFSSIAVVLYNKSVHLRSSLGGLLWNLAAVRSVKKEIFVHGEVLNCGCFSVLSSLFQRLAEGTK